MAILTRGNLWRAYFESIAPSSTKKWSLYLTCTTLIMTSTSPRLTSLRSSHVCRSWGPRQILSAKANSPKKEVVRQLSKSVSTPWRKWHKFLTYPLARSRKLTFKSSVRSVRQRLPTWCSPYSHFCESGFPAQRTTGVTSDTMRCICASLRETNSSRMALNSRHLAWTRKLKVMEVVLWKDSHMLTWALSCLLAPTIRTRMDSSEWQANPMAQEVLALDRQPCRWAMFKWARTKTRLTFKVSRVIRLGSAKFSLIKTSKCLSSKCHLVWDSASIFQMSNTAFVDFRAILALTLAIVAKAETLFTMRERLWKSKSAAGNSKSTGLCS